MLLTISTTHRPATDLGYLLYKHPQRVQTFEVNAGEAHVFYPRADEEECQVALLLEIDPVRLVRGSGRRGATEWTLDQYVNDRPYVASSFLSVAISQVFGTALSGNCKDRPELAEMEIPLTARIPVLPCPGDGTMIRELFEPLGYEVQLERHVLDDQMPEWGPASTFDMTLTGNVRLSDLLSHLYVLIPVLDGEKHYWVGDAEVEKLLRHGQGWLDDHPSQELIARRYLKHQRSLMYQAMESLADEDRAEEKEAEEDVSEEAVEAKVSLNEQRLDRVAEEVLKGGARRVLDLGCGEGKLLAKLRKHPQIKELVGVDVAYRALERAAGRLKLQGWPELQEEGILLFQSSVLYRDRRLDGFDAAVLVEVIEHLDLPKLHFLEENIFGAARPAQVIVTTPNREFNSQWESLPAKRFRHGDHRFEWSRQEFQDWARSIAERYGYVVEFDGIGEVVEDVGSPTQMGVFSRE